MSDTHSVRRYFLDVVLPAYEEFVLTLMDGVLGKRRDLIALGKVAESCLHLADHAAADPDIGPYIPGSPSSKTYVNYLSKKYGHFALTRDIANSFKHRRISRNHRKVEGLNSLKEYWALVRYSDNEGHYFATRKIVIVQLMNGRQIFAEDIIERCLEELTRELKHLGVIEKPPRKRQII